MPELPEVERVRRTLEPRLVGRRVAAVEIRRPDVIRDSTGARSRRATQRLRRAALSGLTIASLIRHGKQLAIESAEGPAIVVHLGMSGQLFAAPPQRELLRERHTHVVWRLEGEAVDRGDGGKSTSPPLALMFRDPRRFGGVWLFDSLAAIRGRRWSRLGPDALHVTAIELRGQLRGQRSIKAALLDQAVIAGVGNIYADEALFMAGIHPAALAGDLTPAERSRLARAIRRTLNASIESGGTTLRDFVDGESLPGGYRTRLRVYGRAGEPCLECGGVLARDVLAQRSTVYCPLCQPERDT